MPQGAPGRRLSREGHYSRELVLVNTVYNHNSTGRAPTGASSAPGGRDITLENVRRYPRLLGLIKEVQLIRYRTVSVVRVMGGNHRMS